MTNDNNIPNPGLGPAIAVLITVVRFAVAMVAGWIIMQLARLGITIDSAQMQLAIYGLLSLAWLAVARWLEEHGILTRMLGVRNPPKYTPPKP